MKLFKKILGLVAVLIISCSFFTGCTKDENTITVGAKDYTEQDILGNLVTVLLEETTALTIEYKHEMSSNILFEAIKRGDVDVCVDYTGTIYGSYLQYSDMKNADEVYQISEKEMSEKFNLDVLQPLGFNNTYCLAVLPETAKKYNLKTFLDLAKVSQSMIFGGSFEILERNDGLPNLKIMYDMKFKEEIGVEGVLRYQSIERGDTQVTEAFSTDGMLSQYNLTVLEDDKNFFPPYHAVPVIRSSTAKKHPELVDVLNKLSNIISDEDMRNMNFKVDVEKKNPKDIAVEFLKSKNLI